MKIEEISWFGEFECLGASCPHTCCRGWVIPLSEQDCNRLREEKGRLGISLFFATGGWSRMKFNSSSGRCTFYGRDGLCGLQKKKGHEFIPWTCQSYPRFYRNYGDFEECCLDLSCPGAARLFMRHEGATGLIFSEGDPHTMVCTTNDDTDHMDILLRLRSEMMDAHETDRLGCYADTLFLFAQKTQDIFANDAEDAATLSFKDFFEKRLGEHPGSIYCFPLPAAVLEGFLNSSLCHVRLRKIDPHLYSLFTKAKRYIQRIRKEGKDWKETAETIVAKEPLLRRTLGRYLAYYLFQYYMRTFETYSFRRQTALGLCHMNMILLLTVASKEAESITEETLAKIISYYNRRAYFNDDIQDQMYRIFEDGFKGFSR